MRAYMDFKIPEKLQIGCSAITVKKVKQCTDCEIAVDGYAIYSQGVIELRQDDKHSEDYKNFVFFHELVHHVFDQMEEAGMRKNEKLVSMMARYLYQAIKTME
jgi:Zn-dependent peptidase ImmA (M78 family)